MTLTTKPRTQLEARRPFGKTPDGVPVEAVEIAGGRLSARILTYGGALQSLIAPDRGGRGGDVVLGHDTVEPYVQTPMFLGGLMGRYANRIARGAFTIDGKTYQAPLNDGPNTLHGGRGFDKRHWRIEEAQASRVVLSYLSADGEEGFPGALKVTASYTLTEADELIIAFEAETDAPTIVSLTSHAYFNLGGVASGRSVLGHRLTMAADYFTPVNSSSIPTGDLRAVAGTPFDFREATSIGARVREAGDEQIRIGRGYDHNFVLRGGASAAPKFAARLEDPVSGRVMELLTTEPGLQFYSGNFLDGTLLGKDGVLYRQSDALCLEPQHFPDSPNKPAFPSPRLDPGQIYRQTSIYRFSTSPIFPEEGPPPKRR